MIADNPTHYDNYDPGLLDLVPKSTTVVRVRNPDPWRAFQEKRAASYRQTVASMNTETVMQVHAEHERPLRTFVRGAVRESP